MRYGPGVTVKVEREREREYANQDCVCNHITLNRYIYWHSCRHISHVTSLQLGVRYGHVTVTNLLKVSHIASNFYFILLLLKQET